MARRIKRFFLIAAILAIAIMGAGALSKMKPPPAKKEVADVDILVEVLPLELSAVQFTVESQGNVRPRTETVLSAELSGTIVSISPKFIAGGVFRKGEQLLRIDPSNYTVAVDQAKALLRQREIEHEGALSLREKGYRAEAEVASAAAALASATAGLTRAQRDLERTYIRLPYDGMVTSKDVDLGQYVSPGSRLGVTFATDYAEVRLPLTDQDLAFVTLPAASEIADAGSGRGPSVELYANQRGQPTRWQGSITRTEGVVDEKTRVTYAVTRVEDPYCLSADTPCTPLPVGTFVGAQIAGNSVGETIRVPRTALRGNNQLMFVDENDRLEIREVSVLRFDTDYAYLNGGASAGERITLTTIESPINGMQVRTADDTDGGEQFAQSAQ